jgi:dipeptidyl-peptidase 4
MKTKLPKKMLVLVFILPALVALVQGQTKKMTLEDVFKNRKFSTRGAGGIQSMKDGEHYSMVKKDSLNIYEYATGKLSGTVVTSSRLVPPGDSVPIPLNDYEFSADESRLLFSTDEEPLYRRSSMASYYIYDLKKSKLVPLSFKGKQRLATFSPDGSKVAFVRDNNLFMVDLEARLSDNQNKTEVQITTDGVPNAVINGATDWVYEEEFEFSKAFFWSPDSKRIAYYRFDESRVKEYQLTYYGDLYPEQFKYKYPKAGEDNSLITIHIWDLSTGVSIPVDIGTETDMYIPRVSWTHDPMTLSFYRMNRHQNKLELLLAGAAGGESRVVYTENNKYYIEINDHLTFLDNGSQFLLSNETSGYRHLYLYDMSGKEIAQLTKGNWDVRDLCGIDQKNGLVYYVSSETSPLDASLWSVKIDGTGKKKIASKEGTNNPVFSSTFEYFVNSWSDINTPPIVTVNRADGQEVRLLQDNAKVKDAMSEYGFGKTTFFSFKTEDGIELNGWMLKPIDFDPLKKYPVLFTVYGGPGSQTVVNRWGAVSSWNQLLAQHEILIVSVDNRGTGARGEEFKKCTYLQLGKYETLDQIEAAKYLGTLPFVDKDRIGMWGWSFGGYLTLSCLTKGADYFHLGVAVAPVTNWRYYDNIYTERFMRTPKENESGYEENSPINHAQKLKGKLLLIHGMADDNVHTQNSYDMVTALVEANKQFESQFYPNSNHGIYTGMNTTFHLYTRMTDFILSNL